MDVQGFRSLLLDERARLIELRDGLAGGTAPVEPETAVDPGAGGHIADVASETFERSRDLSIVGDFDGLLDEIDHAMHRLDTGSFGRCEACGAEIGEERLTARPMARFCIDDQKEAEREAHLR
jgi:RNA polymerase-binding protein DksA